MEHVLDYEITLDVIEDENGSKFWEFRGRLDHDDFYGKDPEILNAIIKSGWSSTRKGAAGVANELGHNISPEYI